MAHGNLGLAYLMTGQVDPAIRHFDVAITLDPTFAMAIGGKAHALQAKGRLDEAIKCFERVVALVPSSPKAREDLANAKKARVVRP